MISKKLNKVIEDFREYAILKANSRTNPEEACGLIITNKSKKLELIQAKNINEYPANSFTVDPEDYVEALNKSLEGEIAYVIHSHIGQSSNPSDADIQACNSNNIPWIIVSTYVPLFPDPYLLLPDAIELPLINREFNYQTNNCYTLIQDYFKRELNIVLNSYPPGPSASEWELPDTNHYEENFAKENFIRLSSNEPLKKHDVILMQLTSNYHPDHAAILVDLEQNKILHHVLNTLSGETTYGGLYRNNTSYVLRHASLFN